MAEEQLYIIPTIKKRKITYFGHMIRRTNIHILIFVRTLEGNITRGRPITQVMTHIKEGKGMIYENLVRLAQYRELWRIMTAHLIDDDDT